MLLGRTSKSVLLLTLLLLNLVLVGALSLKQRQSDSFNLEWTADYGMTILGTPSCPGGEEPATLDSAALQAYNISSPSELLCSSFYNERNVCVKTCAGLRSDLNWWGPKECSAPTIDNSKPLECLGFFKQMLCDSACKFGVWTRVMKPSATSSAATSAGVLTAGPVKDIYVSRVCNPTALRRVSTLFKTTAGLSTCPPHYDVVSQSCNNTRTSYRSPSVLNYIDYVMTRKAILQNDTDHENWQRYKTFFPHPSLRQSMSWCYDASTATVPVGSLITSSLIALLSAALFLGL